MDNNNTISRIMSGFGHGGSIERMSPVSDTRN